MAGNLIVRPLGPLVAAMSQLRQSLYQPPRDSISSVDESLWPNPLQPVQPMGPPKAEPLSWPFNWGRNLLFTPREDAEYSAADLRRLSRYPLARVCIENNKDILTRMPRKIQLKPIYGETSKQRARRAANDPKLKKLNDFFDRPNPESDWATFMRPIIEDMLVIDAASIFVARDKKGNIAELRWVEGASITRLVDSHGWTPQPPNPAYQQLWEGYPRLNLTTEQLIYRPRNIVPRNTQSSYLYGYSPTEQMAEEIKIGISRLNFVYEFYANGNIPGGMMFAPVGTAPDKIREAQQWLDSDLAGDLAKRRRLQILQGFQMEGKAEQVVFPKEPQLADLFDEVHTRRICFAFGTSPQRLMRQMNRASAQAAQESAEEEGTLPWLNWLKGLCDYIIQVVLKEPDYEFAFDPFQELDRLKQAMADAKDVQVGIYTRNEIRENRGDDPVDDPAADQLSITTSTGTIPIGKQAQPASPTSPGGKRTRGAVPTSSKQPPTTGNTRNPKQEFAGGADKVASFYDPNLEALESEIEDAEGDLE